MARADAESGLTFAGFAIFQCPLKPESEPALRMLRDSNHQVRLGFATGIGACSAVQLSGP